MMATTRFMKGNEAAAEAAIRAGVHGFFGYPLTPSTEVAEYMSAHLQKRGGVFVQAESEIASINMMYGGSSLGYRVMTATSGCGFSLMTEGLSYMSGCELPALVINVMRAGPGVGGLNPSQGDYAQMKACGHGGHMIPVYAPSTAQEVADYVAKALAVGDQYRTPVVMALDGSIGQLMEDVTFSDEPAVLPEKPWSLNGPFAGREPHHIRSNQAYTPGANHWTHLFDKAEQMTQELPECEEFMTEDAEIILVAFGSVGRKCKSVVRKARAQGLKIGVLRPITLVPFPRKTFEKYKDRDVEFLDIEMNNGLMLNDVIVALGSDRHVHFYRNEHALMPTMAEIHKAIAQVKEAK